MKQKTHKPSQVEDVIFLPGCDISSVTGQLPTCQFYEVLLSVLLDAVPVTIYSVHRDQQKI